MRNGKMKEQTGFRFDRIPGSVALGVSASVGTFKNPETWQNVVYLWLCINLLLIQVSCRIPVRRYGIRGVV